MTAYELGYMLGKQAAYPQSSIPQGRAYTTNPEVSSKKLVAPAGMAGAGSTAAGISSDVSGASGAVGKAPFYFSPASALTGARSKTMQLTK